MMHVIAVAALAFLLLSQLALQAVAAEPCTTDPGKSPVQGHPLAIVESFRAAYGLGVPFEEAQGRDAARAALMADRARLADGAFASGPVRLVGLSIGRLHELRATFGQGEPYLEAFAANQRWAFRGCSAEAGCEVPTVLTADEKPIRDAMLSDRAVQRATALYYGGHFEAARTAFLAFAGGAPSDDPNRVLALYMAARSQFERWSEQTVDQHRDLVAEIRTALEGNLGAFYGWLLSLQAEVAFRLDTQQSPDLTLLLEAARTALRPWDEIAAACGDHEYRQALVDLAYFIVPEHHNGLPQGWWMSDEVIFALDTFPRAKAVKAALGTVEFIALLQAWESTSALQRLVWLPGSFWLSRVDLPCTSWNACWSRGFALPHDAGVEPVAVRAAARWRKTQQPIWLAIVSGRADWLSADLRDAIVSEVNEACRENAPCAPEPQLALVLDRLMVDAARLHLSSVHAAGVRLPVPVSHQASAFLKQRFVVDGNLDLARRVKSTADFAFGPGLSIEVSFAEIDLYLARTIEEIVSALAHMDGQTPQWGSPTDDDAPIELAPLAAASLNLLPVRLLVEIASSEKLKRSRRREIALVAWTRAFLLGERPALVAATRLLRVLAPDVKDALDGLDRPLDNARDRTRAVLMLARNPGFLIRFNSNANLDRAASLALQSHVRRRWSNELSKSDLNDANWWCPFDSRQYENEYRTIASEAAAPWLNYTERDYWNEYYDRKYGKLTRILPPAKAPYSQFRGAWWKPPVDRNLPPLFRLVDRLELEHLAAAPAAPEFFARYALDQHRGMNWFDRMLGRDAFIPELLHLAVRASRYACPAQDGLGLWSNRAYRRLHASYGETPWAKKTRYWYGTLEPEARR